MLCTLSGERSVPGPWQTTHDSTLSALHGSAGLGLLVIEMACALASSLSWQAMQASLDGFSFQAALPVAGWHFWQFRTSCGKMISLATLGLPAYTSSGWLRYL